jgi:hypothetical protein
MFLVTLFSKHTLCPCSSCNVRGTTFIPIQTAGEVIQGVSLAIGPKVFPITFKVIDVI